MTPLPPGWTCPRRVGFLFPHGCGRLSPAGCPDCQNGQVENPYSSYDRYGYSRYDDYDDGYYSGYHGYYSHWGGGAYPDEGYAISQGVAADEVAPDETGELPPADADFTEADGADLVKTDDQFEEDMTES
jgi:hypothetical protein